MHTAGSVGGSTALVAAHLVTSGIHKRVLTVAFEKQSDSDAMWALSVPQPFSAPLLAGAGGYFAPHIRAYMRRSGRPRDIGMKVAVKDRLHALGNPYAHLHMPDISAEDGRGVAHAVGPAPLPRGLPLLRRRGRDGARLRAAPPPRRGRHRPPAGLGARHGHALGADHVRRPGPDQPAGRPRVRQDVYRQAGITDPRQDFDCAEVYVPFSWYEPMWLENLGFCDEGDGWKLTDAGATSMDGGDIPWNCSGGVLSSNPIGASGMLRFFEAALQVRGEAGEHQVDGARRALGQAYGGGSQFFAMWVVGIDKP